MAKLLSDDIEGRSVARKLSSLRQLFRFLLMDRVISADLTASIRSPKGWKILPKALAASEMNAMLDQTSEYEPAHFKYLTRRDQALFELLYAGGLRASEVSAARLADLNLNERLLIVRGKGDKERIVPFGVRAAQAMQHWLAIRLRLIEKRVSPWLFPGRCGRHITRQRVWKLVRERSQGKAHPHMFRHSFATHMLDNGADLRDTNYAWTHGHFNNRNLYPRISTSGEKAVYGASSASARPRSPGTIAS